MGFFKKVLGSSTPPPLVEVPGGLIPSVDKSRRSKKKHGLPETVFFKEIDGAPGRNKGELSDWLANPAGRFRMGRAGEIGQHGYDSRRRGPSQQGLLSRQFSIPGAGSRHTTRGNAPFQPHFGVSRPHSGPRWLQQQPLSSRGGVSRHDFANATADDLGPSQPQHLLSRQHHEQQQSLQHTPRPGRIREGDPLPTGRIDPMATVSATLPLGHHGLREHVSGMTHLDVERHGRADDPKANWKVAG